MIHCASCFYPNSKPDLEFNENGICSACISFENRKKTNWELRKKEFIKIVKNLKKKKTGDND